MKKLILSSLCLLAFGFHARAEEVANEPLMSSQALEANLIQEEMASDNGDLYTETQWGRRDDWRRRGDWGRYDRAMVTCYARNFRGQTFTAIGRRAEAAERKALNQCQRQSSHRRFAVCTSLGCQRRRY
jgi:hypothetical protein